MTDSTQQPALTTDHPSTQPPLTTQPHSHPQSLAELAGLPGQVVTILHADRRDNAIVLMPGAGTNSVRVLIDGQDRSLPADIAAIPVTDPAAALALTQHAVTWALTAQHVADGRFRELAEQLDEQRLRHDRQLADIRSYAIGRYRDRDICRQGLDDFLARFDLDPYDPRHRVRFTISGSFDVYSDDGSDTTDTEYHVREFLRIDTDRVSCVDEATVTFDVTADAEDNTR